MKVKTNIRAGKGGSKSEDSTSSSSSGGVNSNSNSKKDVYVPPVYVGRCVGI